MSVPPPHPPSPRRDPGPVLCPSGELTGDAAHAWEDLVHGIWATGSRPIALDLSAVSVLTCPAVHALVRTAAAARQRGVALELRRVPPQAARLLRWAHLDHLVVSHLGAPDRPEPAVPRPRDPAEGPRSWAGLPRTATTAHGTVSSEQLETALHRTAMGDREVERALDDLVGGGPALLALLGAGLISLEPDVDLRGGGWWAEVRWADLDEALTSGTVRATPGQATRARAAVLASGRAPALAEVGA